MFWQHRVSRPPVYPHPEQFTVSCQQFAVYCGREGTDFFWVWALVTRMNIMQNAIYIYICYIYIYIYEQ